MYLLLSKKHVIKPKNPNQQILLLLSLFYFKDLLDSVSEHFLSEYLKAVDDKNMRPTDNINKEIATIQATTIPTCKSIMYYLSPLI